MKKRPGGILAVFKYLDDLTEFMESVKGRGDFDGHEVFSPTSYHEIEHAGDYGASGVRWFTFAGAMTGTLFGFALAFLVDWDWPIIVGGKTPGLPSFPAYMILGFEYTILFGGIATVLGMLIMGRLPNPTQRILDVRFSDDRFGVFVPDASLEGEQAKFLKKCGAEEIREIPAS